MNVKNLFLIQLTPKKMWLGIKMGCIRPATIRHALRPEASGTRAST